MSNRHRSLKQSPLFVPGLMFVLAIIVLPPVLVLASLILGALV